VEIPAALLNDATKPTHDALLRLWKELFKKREPIVQIVLNGATLGEESPDSLNRRAQTIRGKINALSRQFGKPVKTVISVTHMDQLEGYMEFSRFLYRHGAPFEIRIESQEDLEGLEASIEKYESHLSLALTTLPSSDFLRMVAFMRRMPSRLSALSSFVKALQWNDPLSYKPEIIRFHFASHQESDLTISDPFASPITDDEIRNINPWRKHQQAAAALAIAGCLYLIGGYFYEKRLLIRVDHSMDILEAHPPARYNEDWHRLFLNWSMNLEKDLELAFLPNFFPDLDKKIQSRLIGDIYKLYLAPRLKYIAGESYAQEKTIYMLGLIYGSMKNDLGPLIMEQPDEWAKVLDVPVLLIKDYVFNNVDPAIIDLNWNAINVNNPTGLAPAEDPYLWAVFFRRANTACQKDIITPEFLHELQKDADPLLETVERLYRFDLCGRISELLKRVAPVGDRLDWVQRRESAVKQEPIRDFLRFLKEKGLTYPSVQGMTLLRLMEGIKALSRAPAGKDKEYAFSFLGEDFVFSTQKWDDLVTRSRITLFIRDFAYQNRGSGGGIFFGKEDRYPDLVMNPSNDGMLFFVGKGKVDGRLTRQAFEQKVKPVLAELPDFLMHLPIAESEKTAFSSFIYNEAEAYAEKYVSSYRAYYEQFKVQADSMVGLIYILNQIQLPNSQFQEFLGAIKDNTVLDVDDSLYLRPLAIKLGAFEFMKRIMADQNGVMPELGKYKAIMQQMQAELESNEPFMPNNADEAKELRAVLTPAGRICLSIFRNENNSYMNVVQMWLKSVGVPPAFQQPFVTPVAQAYAFGERELEASLDKMWANMCDAYLQPLVTKFPFDRSSDTDIPPSTVENLIGPKGAFWKTFRDYMAPVCQEVGHTWFERKSGLETLRLPRDMLKIANDICRITTTLWDDKGEPKPLIISMKAAPLPPMDKAGPVAVMAYVKTGDASVFAFNQQATWQDFKLEWWKNQTSSIGVEFEDSVSYSKSYKESTVQESAWSFFHLLYRTDASGTGTIRWQTNGAYKAHGADTGAVGRQLNNPWQPDGSVTIDFATKTDPWAVFQFGYK
jgi:hypothetical protein